MIGTANNSSRGSCEDACLPSAEPTFLQSVGHFVAYNDATVYRGINYATRTLQEFALFEVFFPLPFDRFFELSRSILQLTGFG